MGFYPSLFIDAAMAIAAYCSVIYVQEKFGVKM